MDCKPTFALTLLALCLLLSGCEKECCLPNGCERCNGDSRLLVNAILPEGFHAESFALEYDKTRLDFYGNSTLIHEHQGLVHDILIYNNDCERVFLNGYLATTHTETDCDTIHQMPDLFFSYAVQDTLIASDRLDLHLQTRVFVYNIHITLEDNDGRITGCPIVIMNGVASGFDIRRETLYGTTSHRVRPTTDGNTINARMTSWGFSDSTNSLTIVFRQPTGLCRYSLDISEQTKALPKGGDIYIRINVSKEIDEITAEGNDDLTIDLDNWDEKETIIEV